MPKSIAWSNQKSILLGIWISNNLFQGYVWKCLKCRFKRSNYRNGITPEKPQYIMIEHQWQKKKKKEKKKVWSCSSLTCQFFLKIMLT